MNFQKRHKSSSRFISSGLRRLGGNRLVVDLTKEGIIWCTSILGKFLSGLVRKNSICITTVYDSVVINRRLISFFTYLLFTLFV